MTSGKLGSTTKFISNQGETAFVDSVEKGVAIWGVQGWESVNPATIPTGEYASAWGWIFAPTTMVQVYGADSLFTKP